jgi:hypothetical protein
MGVVTGDSEDDNHVNDDTYLADVLLLCVECQRPIKARITSPTWLRVEWIGPSGECQSCSQKAREVSGD